MTIMAGIFGRSNSVSLPDAACDALTRSLSRRPADQPLVHRDARCLLAKVDVGAYGESAFRADADGSISMLAGEPLLVDARERVRSRTEDLDRLHEAWSRGEDDLLSGASGTYCAVHYQPENGRIRLIADKIGLRPLYLWVGDDFLVFATALRILEQLPIVPKRMDLRGITELAALGVPLSDRTPYAGVSMLKAAEIVDVSDSRVSRSRYWRWDSIPESKSSGEELCRSACERFNAAIERRLRGDTATTAFLSGGLDSRCIVTELWRRSVEVRSFNFAAPASQDQVLGREFARQVGVHHREVPMRHEGGNAKFAITLAAALNESASDEVSPERPRLAWSGDGGSIGVGHVRVTPRVVELLRSGDRDTAIDTFLQEQKASVPSRLFRTRIANRLKCLPAQGIAEELEDLHCEDPARSFHLFLMLNDQRRHLADHFEHIDLHRVEYQLPFYDADFLELILSIPMDLCIRHGFYSQWIREFPEVFMSVPWQAYPGSVPCPLPVPEGLSYQWSPKGSRRTGMGRRRTGERIRRASEILAADDFPSPIMRKGALRLALWVHQRGIRDYGYLLRSAERYYTYWRRCDGRYLLPSRGSTSSV